MSAEELRILIFDLLDDHQLRGELPGSVRFDSGKTIVVPRDGGEHLAVIVAPVAGSEPRL